MLAPVSGILERALVQISKTPADIFLLWRPTTLLCVKRCGVFFCVYVSVESTCGMSCPHMRVVRGWGWKCSLISCCEGPMNFAEGGEHCIYCMQLCVVTGQSS